MKKIFVFVVCLFAVLCFTACGGGKKAPQKGWDAYCKEDASTVGVSVKEYKNLVESGLTLSYVYLNDTDTIYYKGSYGSGLGGTSFYFHYKVSENYVSTTSASTAYQYALDLVNGGEKGYTGVLNFK